MRAYRLLYLSEVLATLRLGSPEAAALAFALGALGSLIAWAVVVWLFFPRFSVSTKICKRVHRDTPSGADYRVKLQNTYRRRAITDMGIAARIEFRGLDPDRESTWLGFSIPMRKDHAQNFPALRGRNGRIWFLRIQETDWEAAPQAFRYLREHDVDVATALAARTVTLEDLLAVGNDARVAFACSAAHSLSGIRRTKLTDYRLGDIVVGRFDPDAAVVVPDGALEADDGLGMDEGAPVPDEEEPPGERFGSDMP